MHRRTIVFAFVLAVSTLRFLDSILTSNLVNLYGNQVKEFNPFVNTDSVWSIFFSPVPVVVILAFLYLTIWMFNHPRVVLIAYQDSRNSFFSLWTKAILGAPFLILSLMMVAVLQNACIWYFGEGLWPEVMESWMWRNPVLTLFLIGLSIEILFGYFFRKAMLGLLRRVDYSESTS